MRANGLLLLLFALPAAAADLAPAGQILLPGRLVHGLTALPGGELLAPCEDQSLTVLDDQSAPITRWNATSRFVQAISVAPPGPLQLLAAPLVSGRVEILAWDAQTRHLASQFAFTRKAVPSVPTAWDASGHLYQAWQDGHMESWNAQGDRLWSADFTEAPTALLNDETQGVFVAMKGLLVLLDHEGTEQRRWKLTGRPDGVLQTLEGNLYLWGDFGLWRLDPSGEVLGQLLTARAILGVTTDRQNQLIVTEPLVLRLLGSNGALRRTLSLTREAVAEVVPDDKGWLYVPTVAGMEKWSYAGQYLGLMSPGEPASAVLLTEKGLAAWGGQDWVCRVFTGATLPPFCWPQAGGGPRRAWSTTRPAALVARIANWADEPEFGYFMELAASGEDAKQQKVLTLFEERASDGTLRAVWPFANVILFKLLRSGLTELELDDNYVTNNWPANRLRAFRLLRSDVTPEDREELLKLLEREFDPVNLAQGVMVLASTGWDGDGQLMRMLARLQTQKPREAVLADALVEAAHELWLTAERQADGSLVPLLTAIWKGELPRAVRLKAQLFFQELFENP